MSDYLEERMRKAQKAELLRQGYTEANADKMVARSQSDARAKPFKLIAGGLVLIVIGIGLTVGSYFMDGTRLGVFIIWWAPIAIGAAMVLAGLATRS